jgi:ABC-type xylose transport system permease subunit
MLDAIRLTTIAILLAAAVYCGLRGFRRRIREGWSIKAHLYHARYSTLAVFLFAGAVSLYYKSWAGLAVVPIMLLVIWLEYWLFSG